MCFEPHCCRRVTFDEVGDARARPAAKQQDRAVGECDGAMPNPRRTNLPGSEKSAETGSDKNAALAIPSFPPSATPPPANRTPPARSPLPEGAARAAGIRLIGARTRGAAG